MGLAFSVPEGIKIPSSLLNMFKELRQDVGCSLPSHGNLERWALQVKLHGNVSTHVDNPFCGFIISIAFSLNFFCLCAISILQSNRTRILI